MRLACFIMGHHPTPGIDPHRHYPSSLGNPKGKQDPKVYKTCGQCGKCVPCG